VQGEPPGEDAIRAGTVISLRRTVAVVDFASFGPVRVAAARVRLNAITARTSQAAFAANTPDGRCASAEFFRSAWTCSMMAWPRWVLSAVTVSSVLVVKNAWKRQVSWNTDPTPFIWKATAEDIITKVQRGRETLHQIKSTTDH